MSTVKTSLALVLLCSSASGLAHAQASAASEPSAPQPATPAAAGVDSRGSAAKGRGDAPHAGGLTIGGSLGGGQIRDKAVGVSGVSLEFHLGYFPKDWLGIALSGSAFVHQVNDTRNLNFYGAALLAELHPLRRLWVSVGPGYYALSSSVEDKAAMKSTVAKSAKSFGVEANIGFDVYRPHSPRGLSTGLVFRTQLASFEAQPVFTTLGLIDLRWYGGGNPSSSEVASAEPESQEPRTPMAGPLSVTSSCGDAVSQVLDVLQLGGRPCAYRLGDGGVAQQVLSFAGRLLKGTSYGVWLGRLTGVGNTVRGLSVKYDAAQSAVQLLRYGPGGLVESGFVPVPAAVTQRWRIARTPKKALVWLNDRLIANEDSPLDGAEAGLLTEGSLVELVEVQRSALDGSRARELEALPPVIWPALPVAAPAVEESPAPTEPQVVGATVDPNLALLRQYYAGLGSGQFDAARYFSPQVARYIGMRNTTPGAIQSYIDHTFPQQFRRARFEADERTYQSDGPDQFSYVERASYFNVAKGKYEQVTSLVKARFDAQGKLTHLWQDTVLERNLSDQPIP